MVVHLMTWATVGAPEIRTQQGGMRMLPALAELQLEATRVWEVRARAEGVSRREVPPAPRVLPIRRALRDTLLTRLLGLLMQAPQAPLCVPGCRLRVPSFRIQCALLLTAAYRPTVVPELQAAVAPACRRRRAARRSMGAPGTRPAQRALVPSNVVHWRARTSVKLAVAHGRPRVREHRQPAPAW